MRSFLKCLFANRLLLAYCLLLTAIGFLQSCKNADEKKIPDVSNIQSDVKIHRFDLDIRSLDTSNTEGAVAALETKYLDFSNIYFEKVLGIKEPKDSVGKYRREVRAFLTNPAMRHMMDSIAAVYPNFDAEKQQIEQGLRFFKHYFPNRTAPTDIYTMPSAYNFACVFTSEKAVAVGLDMFLGENYSAYDAFSMAQYPRYVSRTFRRDYVVERIFELLVGDLAGEPSGNRLLDYMIQNGKKLYVLDCLLPTMSDSLKLNYTADQMQGTYANEQFTWGRILKQNLLYSIKFAEFQKLVTPAPTAPIIAAEAPGGVGNFIGWQIVRQYMQRNPQTALEELLKMRDAQKLLDLSKYKPIR